jgi:hypothetical protein
MKAPLNIRYVLISDYATVDQSGKLVVAGLYTEDLIVPSVPSALGTLVLTVLAETPERILNFQLTVETPSGAVLMGGDGKISAGPNAEGSRPRTLLGFQFHQVVLPEGGDYKVMIADRDNVDEKFEIHRFRVVVNSQAHAEATSQRSHVEASPQGTISEAPTKRRSRRVI